MTEAEKPMKMLESTAIAMLPSCTASQRHQPPRKLHSCSHGLRVTKGGVTREGVPFNREEQGPRRPPAKASAVGHTSVQTVGGHCKGVPKEPEPRGRQGPHHAHERRAPVVLAEKINSGDGGRHNCTAARELSCHR